MVSIVSYQKASDQHTIYQLNCPEGSTELATIEGTTYVSLPDGQPLPEQQPEQIAASIQTAVITQELIDLISDACVHVALIDQRVRERISVKYRIEDEIKLIRTAPSPEFEAYNAYVEDCREWGRLQKAALGLVKQP